MDGSRAAARVTIQYRHGVLSGKGASLIEGYMEDLATDRIYRLMLSQRVLHRDVVDVLDENGKPVPHTPTFLSRLYDEELAKLLEKCPEEERDRYRLARNQSEAIVKEGRQDPV